MLRLRHSLPGQYEFASVPALLTLPRDGFLALPKAYPSLDTINILEAKSLRFLQSIALDDAIPRLDDQINRVECIAVDQELNLLFGSVGDRVGIWEPSSSFRNRNLFRVHSTLTHKARVNLIVSRNGMIFVDQHVLLLIERGTKGLLAIASSEEVTIDSCSKLAISPGLANFLYTKERASSPYLFARKSKADTVHIHMCQVEEISWRAPNSNRSDTILYTVTADYTVRIYMPVLDSADHLQLHASLDLPDAVVDSLGKAMERPIEGSPQEEEEEKARRTRLKSIIDEGWDLFAVVTQDGTVVVRAITNIDRRPPTLLHQFATLHSPHKLCYPAYVALRFAMSLLSPLSFFDAQVGGVRRLSVDEAGRGSIEKIQRFVRTASGLALGAAMERWWREFWTLSGDGEWRATGQVHTERTSIKLAKCSTAKKSALVATTAEGKEELTIWDHKESEFASGLEYTLIGPPRPPPISVYPGNRICPACCSLCQQRLTYFDDETAWVEIGKVETSQLIPYHISDSIWLAGGLLLVGAGHQMLCTNSEEPTPLNNKPREQHSDLFEIVSSHNGPLEDHHPQMLLQCLLWDGSSVYEFNTINFASSDDPHSFSRRLVERLLQKLEQQRLPHLSETEQAHLIVMIQTTLEIDERALDANGLRYLISSRSFYTLNKRLETFGDNGKQNGIASTRAGKRERLRYRDIVGLFIPGGAPALKNAFALLGKQRFEFAAAFFMLGGSLQDAPELLRAILVKCSAILTKIVVAFKEGNRWLGSWAFWMLDRRDLAVRILLTPLGQLASSLQGDFTINEIGNPHFDDPSLALLFAQLKSKSLQTVKGVNEISGQTEFNFVLQMARVFCRMGCHPLALAITTSWSFDRPTLPTQGAVRRNSSVSSAPSSPTLSRRGEIQPRPRNHTRRKSLIMDMDISALPPTRTVLPCRRYQPHYHRKQELPKESLSQLQGSDAIQPRKTGIGSLMQAAKQEVKVPEFDMGAFDGANGTSTTPVPPGTFEMNTSVPQYFATGVPEPGHHPAQHEYYTGPPMPPPPPLPEPPGTSNGSEAIINAAKAERTAQDRERGRLRVQRFRMKRKLADVDAGRRDKDTLKKIKFPSAIAQEGESNGAGPSTPAKSVAPVTPPAPNPITYAAAMPHLQPPMIQYQTDEMFNVSVETQPMLPPPPLHQTAIPDQTEAQSTVDISQPPAHRPRPRLPHPLVSVQSGPIGSTPHVAGGWSESVLEKVRKAAVKEAESWDAARIDDIVKPDNPSVFEGGLMSLDESGQEEQTELVPLTQV
ncbi:RAVE protein 1 C terminal [Rhizoctonia solani]|uniref:RAVE protein 1 C terminal n=1 Tax=Rhizoctonia solani TaxID=456999 RepID=A0A8H7IEF0_9AGAM|nr:RAVE protein 1 C terminal [Rhizoctonia solani]